MIAHERIPWPHEIQADNNVSDLPELELYSGLYGEVLIDDEVWIMPEIDDLSTMDCGDLLLEDDISTVNFEEVNFSDSLSGEIVLDEIDDSLEHTEIMFDASHSLSGDILIDELDTDEPHSVTLLEWEKESTTSKIALQSPIREIYQSTPDDTLSTHTPQWNNSYDVASVTKNVPVKVSLMAMAQEGAKAFTAVKNRVDVMGKLAEQMEAHMRACTGLDGGHAGYKKITSSQIEQAREQAMINVLNTKFGEKLARSEELTKEEEQQVAQIISKTLDTKLGLNTTSVLEKMKKYDVTLADQTTFGALMPNLLPEHLHSSGCGHGSSLSGPPALESGLHFSVGISHNHHDHSHSHEHHHGNEAKCSKHKKAHFHKGEKCPDCTKEKKEKETRDEKQKEAEAVRELLDWILGKNKEKNKKVEPKKQSSGKTFYFEMQRRSEQKRAKAG